MYHGIQKFDPNKEKIHLEMQTGRISDYFICMDFIFNFVVC
jgi:hypothetical protein